jgi:hypothetical protein
MSAQLELVSISFNKNKESLEFIKTKESLAMFEREEFPVYAYLLCKVMISFEKTKNLFFIGCSLSLWPEKLTYNL